MSDCLFFCVWVIIDFFFVEGWVNDKNFLLFIIIVMIKYYEELWYMDLKKLL